MVSAVIENSTIDINQPPVARAALERQDDFCYFVLPYDNKNVTKDIADVPTSRGDIWNYYPAHYLVPSVAEAGSATTVAVSGLYSAIKATRFNQWVCGFLFASGRPFAPNQVLTQAYYEESALTFPGYVTVTPSSDDSLKLAVRDQLNSFDYEGFDTDAAYYLTDSLAMLVEEKGKSVIRVIDELISEREISDNAIYETLRAIGRLQDDSTKTVRLELLLKLLQNKTPLIRDGTVVALSFLDDRRALPSLHMLLEKETVPILRENIKVAIKDLETT